MRVPRSSARRTCRNWQPRCAAEAPAYVRTRSCCARSAGAGGRAERRSARRGLTLGVVALYMATSAPLERRAVVAGHAIRATDADWQFGRGPVLEGTAMAIVRFLVGLSDVPPQPAREERRTKADSGVTLRSRGHRPGQRSTCRGRPQKPRPRSRFGRRHALASVIGIGHGSSVVRLASCEVPGDVAPTMCFHVSPTLSCRVTAGGRAG